MKLVPVAGSVSAILGFGGWATVGHSYANEPLTRGAASVDLDFALKGGLGSFEGGICVNTLLSPSEKALLNKNGIGDGVWATLNDKFKNAKGSARGCVAVSWVRAIGTNARWGGTIRYEWLFSKGDETIVFTGYYDTQYNSENNWRAVYINTKDSTKGWKMWLTRNHQMPQKPPLSSFGALVHPDWTKVCLSDSCQATSWTDRYSNRWMWNEDGNGGKTFSDWSNFNEITHSYDNGLNDLKTAMEGEGTWVAF